MDVVVLNMIFDNSQVPDFGSMKMDKRNEYLHLLGTDVDKLNSVLTRAVCVGAYNAGTFYFQSGDVAIVDDTQRAFVYNSTSDSWHEWEI
jgi:hypothetical protein